MLRSRSRRKFLEGYSKGLKFGLQVGSRRRDVEILDGLKENLKLKRNGKYRDGYEQALRDIRENNLPKPERDEEDEF